jgi:D-sedoheptulose 7-phosphate isomerase
MIEDIKKFKGVYKDLLVKYLEEFGGYGKIVDFLKQGLNGGTVYIFGNGGSYAIAEQLNIILKKIGGVRTNLGLCQYYSQKVCLDKGYDDIFLDVLEREKVGKEDLVVLISGSGDSDNVVKVGSYCSDKGVPCMSFSGFSGGAVYGVVEASYVAGIHDQQICEDAMQCVWHIVGYLLKGEDVRGRFVLDLVKCFDDFDFGKLDRVSSSIVDAYLAGKNVFVLAPHGGSLGFCAEHIAHNLNWDAAYKVDNAPPRNVFSTSTRCDFSGITNDRLIKGVMSLQTLQRAKQDDVLILFFDKKSTAVERVLKFANEKGLQVYCVDNSYNVLENVFVDFVQIIGHICGRLVRLKLKQGLGQEIGKNVYDYLVSEDLAQRRLLTKDGL